MQVSSSGRAAFLSAAFAAFGIELAILPQAAADPMVPTVIADAETGEVLQSEQATRPWYPASTTKLMTAYAALRAVRAGQIRFDTPIVVSVHAARQPPSKIGVRPGQEITLENALKILMVKSANDISVVVAEGVAGSVPGFATLMNREAARLGMRESHFVNPHGLHSPSQVTSARDMAILARALLLEFPEYRDLFSMSAVQLGTRVYHNTNGLIGRYSGAMGMKTGFICASGFNLVSAARRNGRTLIAVVFGATNGADRTLKAAQLLDQGFGAGGGFFGRTGSGSSLAALPASHERSAPNRRAEICGRRGPPASEEEDYGAIIVASGGNDNPMVTTSSFRMSESAAVGQRSGGRVMLGQRAPADPVAVYLGRKPGSTEVARRPGAPREENDAEPAQAFAAVPRPPAQAAGMPLALTGAAPLPPAAARPGAQTRIGTAQPAAVRPANSTSLLGRATARTPDLEPIQPRAAPKAEPRSAALQPALASPKPEKAKADKAKNGKAKTEKKKASPKAASNKKKQGAAL